MLPDRIVAPGEFPQIPVVDFFIQLLAVADEFALRHVYGAALISMATASRPAFGKFAALAAVAPEDLRPGSLADHAALVVNLRIGHIAADNYIIRAGTHHTNRAHQPAGFIQDRAARVFGFVFTLRPRPAIEPLLPEIIFEMRHGNAAHGPGSLPDHAFDEADSFFEIRGYGVQL